MLRSGSVSAKELESVRRIDCFGEFGIPFRAGKWKNLGLEMAMHWIQSMERKIHRLPFLWVEEIATSESESSFAFPRRLGSPRSDASASFPEMELGEENIGSRLVDLPRLEREGEIK